MSLYISHVSIFNCSGGEKRLTIHFYQVDKSFTHPSFCNAPTITATHKAYFIIFISWITPAINFILSVIFSEMIHSCLAHTYTDVVCVILISLLLTNTLKSHYFYSQLHELLKNCDLMRETRKTKYLRLFIHNVLTFSLKARLVCRFSLQLIDGGQYEQVLEAQTLDMLDQNVIHLHCSLPQCFQNVNKH